MAKFSKKSQELLGTCDPRLQKIFNKVIVHFDCRVMCGYRDEQEQNEKHRTGASKKKYPNSKHNTLPSNAVDVAPYPIDWNDRERFTLFAGFVKGIAISMGYVVRWGGDWDGDTQVKNNDFDDLPHFEIIDNL